MVEAKALKVITEVYENGGDPNQIVWALRNAGLLTSDL